MKRRLFASSTLALLGLGACTPYPQSPGYYNVPPRAFQVYFAFGSIALTPQDQAMLRDAAAYANSRPGTRIRIIGNADAPGPPEGNAAISLRRSEVVTAELNRNGVLRERMTLEAYGDARPAVVTNPGGMQPENRRVDILIY
jgi:OOP family OmpA-OmpF porin